MSKKKLLIAIVAMVVGLFGIFKIWTLPVFVEEDIEIVLKISCDSVDGVQMFYNTNDMEKDSFDVESSAMFEIRETEQYEEFSMLIPSDVAQIRIDLGETVSRASIENVYIKNKSISLIDNIEEIISKENDCSIEKQDDAIIMTTDGEDPYVVINVNQDLVAQGLSLQSKVLDTAIRVVLTLGLVAVFYVLYKKRDYFLVHVKDLYNNRHMVMELAKNDFKSRFSGSYLGVFWAFANPIVVVTIYWFVFDVGFKSQPVSNFPYLLWLVAGICPWFFFNEAVNSGTSSLFEYSYIVKKVVFKISLIPIIKILSAVFIHVFFIALVIFLFVIYGEMPSVYVFQVLYYSVCTFVLSLGITYLTSSLSVFFKDLSQIVNIVLQFGMWLTPIMYSEDTFGTTIQQVLKLNPMYYVVSGYRDSLIYGVGFWEKPELTLYFWVVTIIVFVIGRVVFKKMRPHFADVL